MLSFMFYVSIANIAGKIYKTRVSNFSYMYLHSSNDPPKKAF